MGLFADHQAGFEKSMTMLTAALAGRGMVYESVGILANWIVNGHPNFALPFVHPSRFSNNLAKEKVIDMIIETYARGYSIDDF